MNQENYPIDDFSLNMMKEVRRLNNLVEALRIRINKQDEAIGKFGMDIHGLKQYNNAKRNSDY